MPFFETFGTRVAPSSLRGIVIMKVAIALFGTRVSPRFDCAPAFRVIEANNGTITGEQTLNAETWNAVDRINKLRELGINVLICGGIDMFSAQKLNHCNVTTYSWITGEAKDALECLLRGELQPGFMMGPGGRCCGRWRFGHGRRRRQQGNRQGQW